MTMIHDLEVARLDVNATEYGSLVECQRTDWDVVHPDPEMATAETVFPDTVRAWQRHPESQVDHLTVPRGQIELAVYDDREDSPTSGETDSFVIGEKSPALVRIPVGVWHGYEVLGPEPALVLNFPSELYDYYEPDKETLPADTDEIPHEWD